MKNPQAKSHIVCTSSINEQSITIGGNVYSANFSSRQLANIYNSPSTITTSSITFGVISLGGGLYGTVDSRGVLTNGDCQSYWAWEGISTSNHPKVVIVSVDGSPNVPDVNDGGSTSENTLDIETIGSWCPGPNVTIIIYIAANNN